MQINVYGHVVGQRGVEEPTQMINDAIRERDVRLVGPNMSVGEARSAPATVAVSLSGAVAPVKLALPHSLTDTVS